MIAHRKRKIYTIVFILSALSLTTALILYALRQNISLFYTPTQITLGVAPHSRWIRVGGMVEKNSIKRAEKGLQVIFNITDYQNSIPVLYEGILPDLFREEQGIVAEGRVDRAGRFIATQILAKHDANYMPPEAREALRKKGSL